MQVNLKSKMSSSGAKNGIAYFQAFSGKLAQRSPHLQRPSFTHGQSLGILFCRMPRLLPRCRCCASASALAPSLHRSFDAKMLQLKRRIFARNVIGLLHAHAIAEFRTQPGSYLCIIITQWVKVHYSIIQFRK